MQALVVNGCVQFGKCVCVDVICNISLGTLTGYLGIGNRVTMSSCLACCQWMMVQEYKVLGGGGGAGRLTQCPRRGGVGDQPLVHQWARHLPQEVALHKGRVLVQPVLEKQKIWPIFVLVLVLESMNCKHCIIPQSFHCSPQGRCLHRRARHCSR